MVLVWRWYTLGNPAAGKTRGRRSGLEVPGGEREELGGPTGGSLNSMQGGGQGGCPQKHPRYAPHIPCLSAEGPGWGHCTAEIHRSSVECGCWFSHLDFAGIPPITSSHHHHHHRHLHTCVKKTCLFAKAIMTSEQMVTSPRHHPSPARAGLPQAHVPWVLDPRTPPPPPHRRQLSLAWCCLGRKPQRPAVYSSRGWGGGAELGGMWHPPDPLPDLASSGAL